MFMAKGQTKAALDAIKSSRKTVQAQKQAAKELGLKSPNDTFAVTWALMGIRDSYLTLSSFANAIAGNFANLAGEATALTIKQGVGALMGRPSNFTALRSLTKSLGRTLHYYTKHEQGTLLRKSGWAQRLKTLTGESTHVGYDVAVAAERPMWQKAVSAPVNVASTALQEMDNVMTYAFKDLYDDIALDHFTNHLARQGKSVDEIADIAMNIRKGTGNTREMLMFRKQHQQLQTLVVDSTMFKAGRAFDDEANRILGPAAEKIGSPALSWLAFGIYGAAKRVRAAGQGFQNPVGRGIVTGIGELGTLFARVGANFGDYVVRHSVLSLIDNPRMIIPRAKRDWARIMTGHLFAWGLYEKNVRRFGQHVFKRPSRLQNQFFVSRRRRGDPHRKDVHTRPPAGHLGGRRGHHARALHGAEPL